MEDDEWGNEEDEERIFAFIQESDYRNAVASTSPLGTQTNFPTPRSSSTTATNQHRSNGDDDPLPSFDQQNYSELRAEMTSLQRKLEEAVKLNSELKNRNCELQGEAGTLRRRLDQDNLVKQELICKRIQNVQDAKKQESEERKKLKHEIESLKSQLDFSKLSVKTLEEKNRKLMRRDSLGLGRNSVSNPAIVISTPPNKQSASAHSPLSYSTQINAKNAKSFQSWKSFTVSEDHLMTSSSIITKDSKEVQTDESNVAAPTSATLMAEREVAGKQEFQESSTQAQGSLYTKIKLAARRLIVIEVQLWKPVVEKSIRDAPTAFKRRLKQKKPRFGLGLEAFDSTALMLQWMDEKEMEDFDESVDIQADYLRRRESIFDKNRTEPRYPPVVDEMETKSEVWPDSEQLLGSSSDEDNIILEDDDENEDGENFVYSQPPSTPPPPPGGSDTSEDEYELECPAPPQQSGSLNEQDDVNISGTQLNQTLPANKKPLIFFKEYKLRSRLLTQHNSYTYLRKGQSLEVIQGILEGLFDEAGVWNTLNFVKNELRFMLEGKGLYERRSLHVFTTLLVWAKNLWTLITAAEDVEKVKLNRIWDKELFGWVDLMLKVVWRPTRSLVEFCRELRTTFLYTISIIVRAGYFDDFKENYFRFHCTLKDTILNSNHHCNINTRLLLDVSCHLPTIHISKYFCKQNLPKEFLERSCLLKELSVLIEKEFNIFPSVALYERYLDFLDKLRNASTGSESQVYRGDRKRKLECDTPPYETDSEESDVPRALNILKDADKCECHIMFIHKWLLMLSKVWGLWQDRFREVELMKLQGDSEEKMDSKINIYTESLIRSFEPLCLLYKFNENILTSFGAEVFTYFWASIASYRKFRKHVSLRLDMDAVLTFMTHDEEDAVQTPSDLEFPPSMEQEWVQLVNLFPELNFRSPEHIDSNELFQEDDEDKEN